MSTAEILENVKEGGGKTAEEEGEEEGEESHVLSCQFWTIVHILLVDTQIYE